MKLLSRLLLFVAILTIVQCEYTCKNQYDGPYVNKTIEGCVLDCQGFPTLESAQVACSKEPDCNGITFTKEKVGNNGFGYYDGQYSFQLRSGVKVEDTDKFEISYKKTDSKNCKQCWQFYSGPFMNKVIVGCDKGCRDYDNQYDAEEACFKSVNCKGITWSTPKFGGVNSAGPNLGWGFQSRSSNELKDTENFGQFTYLKTKTFCDTEYLYDFEGPYNLQQLSGCVQDCIDFSTFEEASIMCMKDKNCNGITYAHKDNGGAASQGFYNGYGFQLRFSSEPEITTDLQLSWVKFEKEAQNCQIRYNGPLVKQTLDGCFQNCQDFPTLESAVEECNRYKDCKGVTYAPKDKKQNDNEKAIGARDQKFGYQLRKSEYAIDSPLYEISYVKTQAKTCQKCWFQYYGPFFKSLGECDKDCLDFAVQQDAQKACSQSKTCGGITWAKANGGRAKGPLNGWGFQLRKKSDLIDVKEEGEFSFLKGNQVCDLLKTPFTGPYNKEKLGICSQKCKSFSSLQEAQYACIEDPECGGVTWSNQKEDNNDGIYEGYGFQLRSGKDLIPGSNSEMTWVKNICARLFSECNYKGQSVIICVGDAFKNIPDFVVRSIRVPDDFHIVLYNKENMDGDHIVVSENKECMVGDYFMSQE